MASRIACRQAVAEAVILHYRIEHDIRDLIYDVYDEKELSEVLEAMMASANRTAIEVVAVLKQVIEVRGTILVVDVLTPQRHQPHMPLPHPPAIRP